MTDFTHLDNQGRVRMVDVGDKEETRRTAVAEGIIVMQSDTLARIMDDKVKKAMSWKPPGSPGSWRPRKHRTLFPCVIR